MFISQKRIQERNLTVSSGKNKVKTFVKFLTIFFFEDNEIIIIFLNTFLVFHGSEVQ